MAHSRNAKNLCAKRSLRKENNMKRKQTSTPAKILFNTHLSNNQDMCVEDLRAVFYSNQVSRSSEPMLKLKCISLLLVEISANTRFISLRLTAFFSNSRKDKDSILMHEEWCTLFWRLHTVHECNTKKQKGIHIEREELSLCFIYSQHELLYRKTDGSKSY